MSLLRFPRCWFAAASAVAVLLPRPVAALELPPTGIHYDIRAELDPATRDLQGSEVIRWTNPTDEPIAALPVHLYLNAFSHSESTWMQHPALERLESGGLLKQETDPWGWSELVSVRVRGAAGERDATFRPIRPDDGNPFDRTLFEVALPEPVPPGGEVVLAIRFSGRLPIPIARTGGRDGFFLVGQWYPKIGVIEPAGVRHAPRAQQAARQFHGPTEFYADFADYDVRFVLPEGWLVGATGRAVGEPARLNAGPRPGGVRVEFHYQQRAVHDFALVAGQHLVERSARHVPQGGGPAVDVRYIVPAGTEHQIPRWQRAVEGALDVLGRRVGPYPYTTLTVVSTPHWAERTSGMEYPTFITGDSGDPLWDLPLFASLRVPEVTAIHEFGHQYFYGLLASNEQDEAFLDEGFNSFWEHEVMREVYGEAAAMGTLLGRDIQDRELERAGLGFLGGRIREPLRQRPTWLFEPRAAGIQSYARPSVALGAVAARFGRERLDRVFAAYFERYAFRHPDFDDFLTVAEEVGGAELAAHVRELFTRPEVPDYAVVEAVSERWEAPLGRVMTGAGQVEVTRETREALAAKLVPEDVREADGRVLMERTGPGWERREEHHMGTIERLRVAPVKGKAAAAGEGTGVYESKVRLSGPGWDTLPVTVEFRFEDGVMVRDRWDGKAVWCEYRFWRPARLGEVRVDPEGQAWVDAHPENNAQALAPARGFATHWGLWLGALGEWVAGAMSLWL
ncbi:MAG TPA: M1 family metallopeptidase [Polyangia bacterium]|nr:M1 family metallopeptidase [Polyangia bacterium]